MEELAIYLLKSAGILSVFVLIYHFLLRRLTFFQANRWFLLFGLVASVIFPFIEITQTVYVEQPIINPEQVVMNPEQVIYTPTALILEEQRVIADESWLTHFDFQTLLYAIYAMFALFFVGKMTLELVSLYKLIRSGELVRSDRFLLVSLSRKLTPFSFFKYICYTRGEDKEPQFQAILNHEKVHARQYHSMDILIAVVYRAVFWFNPLAWWVKRQITENLEFIADSQAKSSHTSSISYERTLLSVMSCPQQPALANNFFTPFIKERILMLQKETSARWHAYKYALILPIIVVFLYSFNVVEEIKYVVPVDEPVQQAVQVSEKQDIFKIPSSASIDEINAIAQEINEFNSYSLEVLDTERLKGLISKIDLQVIFPEQPDNVHRFSIGHADEALKDILIYTDTDQLSLSEVDDYMSFEVSRDKGIVLKLTENGKAAQELELLSADGLNKNEKMGPDPLHILGTRQILQSEFKKGSKITSESVMMYYPNEAIQRYGNKAKDGAYVHEGKTTLTEAPIVTKKDEVLIIKITANTTQEQLDQKVAKLASYPIDFEIKKAKFKNGKLVRLKFYINDRNGFSTSIDDDSSDGIENVCITMILKEGQKVPKWTVDSCDKVGFSLLNSDQLSDVMIDMNGINIDSLMAVAQRKIGNLDNEYLIKNFKMSNINLDSLNFNTDLKIIKMDSIMEQLNLNADNFKFFKMDSIMSQLNLDASNFKYFKMDSLQSLMDWKEMKLDSTVHSFSMNLPSQEVFTLGEVYYNGELISKEGSQPLIIINGKEVKGIDIKSIPSVVIQSLTVLKEDNAVTSYGKKAKGGAILLEIDEDFNIEEVVKPSESDGSKTSVTYSESVSIDKVEFTDFTREDLEKYSELIKQQGYDFNIRTFRTKGDKVVKLKVDFAGSTYTIVANNEIEKLTFHYYGDGRKPIMTSVSR